MKIKNVSLGAVKAGPEDGLKEGEFIVYPSTFTREPDSYGDVVAKGAFLDGIKAWKDSGDVMPGMYLHDPNQIVAGASDMGEDDHGWWVKGKFDDDDPHAQKVYRWLKGRRLTALSFAYDTQDEGQVELDDDRKANELRKLMPLEFSFLPKGFAANADTSVIAVKTAAQALLSGTKAGRAISAKNEGELRKAHEAIGNVLAAISEDDDQEKASGTAEATSEASDKEPSGVTSSASDKEPKSNPSARALVTVSNFYALI